MGGSFVNELPWIGSLYITSTFLRSFVNPHVLGIPSGIFTAEIAEADLQTTEFSGSFWKFPV
jgi:hypothetical protein